MFRSKETDPTIIGAGAVIEGIIRVKGRVQVDGRIEGTLDVDGEVSVGPKGVVSGELVATNLVVGGDVTGKICARNTLHIVSSGSVRGDVKYESLQIDRGGVIGGTTEHADTNEVEVVKIDEQIPPLPSAASF